MQPRYRLVVYLRGSSGERTLSLDVEDLAHLQAQVDRFEHRRLTCATRRFQMHEFSNGSGDTIAFAEILYQRHDIEDVESPVPADTRRSR